MSIDVIVPAVGESISSGVLAAWHKKDGEMVASGDLLFTLETDKVSTEVQAQDSGVVHFKVQEGEEVNIGAVVATIDTDAVATTSVAAPVTPAKEAVVEQNVATQEIKVAPPIEAKSTTPSTPAKVAATPEPVSQTPSISESKVPVPAMPTALVPVRDGEKITRKKLSPLRRKIATQLVSAQQNAAILTTFNECDMSAVMQLRKEMQEDFKKKHGVKLGFMSFFIKAAVDGLKAVPQINSRMDGDELVQNHFYDIGVAVGTDKGLMVPVLRDADLRSFADIERGLGEFAVKAREGKIVLSDLQGGVFTISNGGIYGSLLSTPILNPPQSGILGMHKIQDRPVAVNGKVEIRPMMYLALSYDHRVVDGKEAVTFLVRVKECIENPVRLLLES